MLNFVGSIIKLFIFSAVILVASTWIRVGNSTIAEHTQSRVERIKESVIVQAIADGLSDMISNTDEFAKEAAQRRTLQNSAEVDETPTRASAPERGGVENEAISSAEREKLRTLIRTLHSEDQAAKKR